MYETVVVVKVKLVSLDEVDTVRERIEKEFPGASAQIVGIYEIEE